MIASGDPTRLWEMDGTGGKFRLRRLKRGDSSTYEYYKAGGRTTPYEFDQVDAQALIEELNALRPPDRRAKTDAGGAL